MSIRNFMSGFLLTTLSLGPLLVVAETQTLFIVAGADNTLYEDPDGEVSNGEGGFMLTGRNNLEQNSIRRAVLYFDVAGQLPHGASVEQASLSLYLERGNGGERVLNLHRMLRDWGEAGSEVLGGGLGAPAQEGDATWLHSFYPDVFWQQDGGHYIGRVSASQTVGDPGLDIDKPGSYTWGDSARMVQDVRRWQRQPEKNFGWILLGDESVKQTAKRFSSRDNINPDLTPVLEVVYTMPE